MIAKEMQILINGQEREFDLPAATPFKEIMREVNRIIQKPGQSVTRINLNGEDITGADWGGYDMMPAKEISNLEIQTSNMDLLALETLDSLDDFLSKLIAELGKAVNQFRIGEDMKGVEIFGLLLDGIQVVNHLTPMIQRNLGEAVCDLTYDGQPIADQFSKMEVIIKDMLAAQEDQDWILLADLIEYEFVPHFEDRQQILHMWREASGE